MAYLKEDYPTTLWGTPVVIPAQTALTLVKGAIGGHTDLYAVARIDVLIRLTGNTHDPRYRYAFVPNDLVGH